VKKQHTFIPGILILLAMLVSGCAREYSFEGADPPPQQDTTSTPGGLPGPQPIICPSCTGNETYQENRWSLSIGSNNFCGIIDTTIALPARTGFTFYGPSACSNDSGMVITIYLNGDTLNHNLQSLNLYRNGFYYYDNLTPSYLVITQPGQPFTVFIESYDHSTRLIKGSFYGFAGTSSGGSAPVSNGKFLTKIL
jgi:hypothetical protein